MNIKNDSKSKKAYSYLGLGLSLFTLGFVASMSIYIPAVKHYYHREEVAVEANITDLNNDGYDDVLLYSEYKKPIIFLGSKNGLERVDDDRASELENMFQRYGSMYKEGVKN